MNEQNTYSDIDILNDAVKSLGKLRIPVEMNDDIGNEVTRVWRNLNLLLQAYIDREKETKEQQLEGAPVDGFVDEPEPEVISEETVGDEAEENT